MQFGELVVAQLQEFGRIAPEALLFLIRRQMHVLDHLNGARLQHRERRRVAAVDEMVGPDGIENHARRRHMIGHRVEIHFLQIISRLVLDLHGRIGTQKISLVLQLIGVVHAADDFTDAAAAMGTDELEAREILQDAAHDQPGNGEAEIGRAANA